MKVTGTILSATALLLGFCQAPTSHIHVDDSDHPVSATLVHSHLHHEHETPVTPSACISAPTVDDDAIHLGWNALGCSSIDIPFAFDITENARLLTVTITSTLLPIPLRGGHDPPKLPSTSPRSPPA